MNADQLLNRLVEDEKTLHVEGDALSASYLKSYPEFIRYFRDLLSFESHHLVIAGNFTYGWLARIVRLHEKHFDAALASAAKAFEGDELEENEICSVAYWLDNSVVATSKLLHFICPEVYAIWDSRVFNYMRRLDNGFTIP